MLLSLATDPPELVTQPEAVRTAWASRSAVRTPEDTTRCWHGPGPDLIARVHRARVRAPNDSPPPESIRRHQRNTGGRDQTPATLGSSGGADSLALGPGWPGPRHDVGGPSSR